MSALKIAVAGASGRMGRMLIEAIQNAEDMVLAGALDLPGSPSLGTDAASFLGKPAGVAIESDLAKGLANVDVLIDFTRPEGTLKHAEYCAAHGIKMVIGTTGLEQDAKDAIAAAATKTAIMQAPNMSIGVNVTLKLLEMAAKSFTHGYDIEIIEAHHRHKVDAPSGTALKMGEVIADTIGVKLDDVAVYAREGITGERDPSSIGFSAIRGGDIVGDHTVLFAGIGERIEITHKSSSRVTYAHGSLRAARFLADKSTGLYDMQDVLGLKQVIPIRRACFFSAPDQIYCESNVTLHRIFSRMTAPTDCHSFALLLPLTSRSHHGTNRWIRPLLGTGRCRFTCRRLRLAADVHRQLVLHPFQNLELLAHPPQQQCAGRLLEGADADRRHRCHAGRRQRRNLYSPGAALVGSRQHFLQTARRAVAERRHRSRRVDHAHAAP